MFDQDQLNCYATDTILDAKYKQLNIKEVIGKQNHFNANQNTELEKMFKRHDTLFNGKLGLLSF